LYIERVAAALAERSADFHSSQIELQSSLKLLETALRDFERLSQADVEIAIAALPNPGAAPTTEQDTLPALVDSFGSNWLTHRSAREWAAQTLQGVTTFAADGSQISPQKDLSIPVGLVQVGWFQNPHDSSIPYEKDVAVELLTPDDLTAEDSAFGDREVEWRRFKGEVERAVRFMEQHANQHVVTFFDGSMVISFVGQMQTEWQSRYVGAIRHLLKTSEETRVPLVGYVDTSYANDLVALLAHVRGLPGNLPISDAALLRPLMSWGDRCRVFICRRDDSVLDKGFYEQICFTYLKTTRDNIPARIEFPRWIFEQGQHDWMLNIVRAECVVGLGYPYVLETADSVAVLTMQDRERFYRLFQDFADREALPLRFSRKAMSKRERRV